MPRLCLKLRHSRAPAFSSAQVRLSPIGNVEYIYIIFIYLYKYIYILYLYIFIYIFIYYLFITILFYYYRPCPRVATTANACGNFGTVFFKMFFKKLKSFVHKTFKKHNPPKPRSCCGGCVRHSLNAVADTAKSCAKAQPQSLCQIQLGCVRYSLVVSETV